jgi:hypothetical protein
MSLTFHEKSILAFIDVIESKSVTISPTDWVELNEMITNLSDDAKAIYSEIDKWLQPESRSNIKTVWQKIIQEEYLIHNLGPARSTGTQSQTYKQLLISMIKKNTAYYSSDNSGKSN